ncbi:hypothetical protein EJ06DRAFT_393870 [Trichodelitschia bisporula]|uniref:Uncharacterized protein n=1 Tax=Trichodelitschia bisporula TaxID=703511 RepID=A0A6G1HZP4_9PEZI|nr:hypothetical protein EJ06DRAFT_393870 [Trichodelitschia bisporula]
MPIIRNPFKKAPVETADPNADGAGFEKTSTMGAKPLDITPPPEYKLSEIDDSGIFLPPSPQEKPSYWSRSSTTSSAHRSVLSDIEPFSISRESFDSYRRSFDISARSPICAFDAPRQSLDSRRGPFSGPAHHGRISLQESRPPQPVDEGFEDVGLDEPKPRRRGLFARFGDQPVEAEAKPAVPAGGSGVHGFLFAGRKRGQSTGQGAELKSIDGRGV